jgi:hypothetical protein
MINKVRDNIGIFLVVLLIFIIGLILRFNYKVPTCDNQGKFETQIIRSETKDDELKIQYPRFSEEKINNLVNNFLQEQKDQFENLKKDQIANDEIRGKNSLYIEYVSSQYNNEIISLKFNISQYILGMAHPNNFVVTKNYSFVNLKEIDLKDLFVDENYLKTISQITYDQLMSNLDKEMEEFVKEGTNPQESNFANFVLDENNLTFVFSSGQVAPYALGEQEVAIDLSQLKNLLQDEFKQHIF